MREKVEHLEIIDWRSGIKSGTYISRTEAHKQGKPHEAVHIWIFTSIDKRVALLFQQRAHNKTNFPGLLDATVGGHVKAGESLGDVLREAKEEINLTVQVSELNFVERHQFVLELTNYKDYEWIDEYFILRRQALNEYRFPDGEVIGLAGIYLDDLRKLQTDANKKIAIIFCNGHGQTRKKMIDRSAFVPHHFKSNFLIRLLDQFSKSYK